ncbi:hypothetical protein, partial [Pseudonocardia sp.]|uniref:hypothetical protein n=1 Tax=Pseudonocardia sp. TaxID=60912 RepID=UPI0031FE4138
MNRRAFRSGGRTRALLVCLALALGAAFAPSGASANTYNVYVCNDAGGANNSWQQYWNSGVSNISSGQTCPTNGWTGPIDGSRPGVNTNQGLFVRSTANGLGTPPGALGGWIMRAPAGNSLNSMTFTDWVTRANGSGWYAALSSDWAVTYGCNAGSTVCGDSPVAPPHSVALNGSSSVRAEVG